MRIVKAELSDVPSLLTLAEEFYKNGDLAVFGPFSHKKTGWSHWLETCITSDKCLVLLCETDGKPVGFLTAMLVSMPWDEKAVSAVETGWYVKKEYRSKGYGKALLDEFMQWSNGTKACVINVGTAENATKTGELLVSKGLFANETRHIKVIK